VTSVLRYTEEKRQQLLELGRKSLFTFAKGFCRFKDLSDIQFELCENLQGRGTWGDWRFGCVTAFRGALKSTITTVAYPAWCGLYPENFGLEDHSTLVLGASYDNVVDHFIKPAEKLFREGKQADFLQWLYQHRLPSDFTAWIENEYSFRQVNPLSQPTVRGRGLGAKKEGIHVNLVLFDDAEGADAEKSDIENADAHREVNNSIPLLVSPERDRILVVGTPHGDDPLIWRLIRETVHLKEKNKDRQIEWDNKNRIWKLYYKPIVDTAGKAVWPERFHAEVIRSTQATTRHRTWDQQYLLLEVGEAQGVFHREDVEKSYFRWTRDGKGIEYPARIQNKKLWYEKRQWEERTETKKVKFEDLRFFMHSDLIHREDTVTRKWTGSARPSKAAIVIVGVAPDGHAFVVATWNATAGIEEQVRMEFAHYQRFGPYKATWDSVGAQAWFKAFIERWERDNPMYQRLKGSERYARGRVLPRLSSILVEDKRTPRMHKEDVIYERLSGPIEDGTLHFHDPVDPMGGSTDGEMAILNELFGAFEATDYVDLIDALSQGPPVWTAPSDKSFGRAFEMRSKLVGVQRHPQTGFYSPFRQGPPPKRRIEDPDGDTFTIKTDVGAPVFKKGGGKAFP